MASHSVSLKHKLLSLNVASRVPNKAASCAIDYGNLEMAIELLEQGRALLWTQAGRYRTPLDKLETVDPVLAAEFRHLGVLLEKETVAMNPLPDKIATGYRSLMGQWEGLIERIRQVDGFSNFLTTTPFASLQKAAINGPVIVVNVDTSRSDAVIIRAKSPPILVPLPRATPTVVADLIFDILDARCKEEDSSRAKGIKITKVLQQTWEIIVQPVVKELLEGCGIARGSRIWWCATSVLWMLPLHAAGPYKPSERNLPDIFVSSYTPTLSALVRSLAPKVSHVSPENPAVLIVGQANTPGQSPLPSVPDEINQVMELIPSARCLDGQHATRLAVLDELQKSPWIHLSCHGHQDLAQPYKSRFALHDGQVTLHDIIQTTHPNAELAFLSACHAAAGDLNSPNEVIHLAASLQFAGYAGVVGTLWAMADIDGPDLARDFYGFMVRKSGGALDYRDAAAALNFATREMRKRKVPIERWINFVHIGA